MSVHDHSHQGAPPPENPEELLSLFQPKPSKRFYQRMDKAPWHRTYHPFRRMRLAFSLTLILILVTGGLTISPPFRAIAMQVFSFFMHDRQDQLLITVEGIEPREFYQYASIENFPLTVEQAEILAGYPAYEPTIPLDDLVFVGARYETDLHTVILLFLGQRYNLFLSQRPLSAQQEYFSIGASAEVDSVLLDHIRGELVSGGWVAIPSDVAIEEGAASIQARWDSTLPQLTLRWQNETFAFELRTVGNFIPAQSDLIEFAIGLR